MLRITGSLDYETAWLKRFYVNVLFAKEHSVFIEVYDAEESIFEEDRFPNVASLKKEIETH